MSSKRLNEGRSIAPGDVAVLMRHAGLPADAARLARLADELDAAMKAARAMDPTASRIPIGDADDFDAAWPDSEGER